MLTEIHSIKNGTTNNYDSYNGYDDCEEIEGDFSLNNEFYIDVMNGWDTKVDHVQLSIYNWVNGRNVPNSMSLTKEGLHEFIEILQSMEKELNKGCGGD